MSEAHEIRLTLRPLTPDDHAAVTEVQRACFPGVQPWGKAQFARQIELFPEGQIGIELDGRLMATSSAMLVSGDDWEAAHVYQEVSGPGGMDAHEPEGDTLYGIDLAVHPEARGLRMARRIYEYRKLLMERWNLRRMFIAGRIPGLSAQPAEPDGGPLSPEAYVRKVLSKRTADSTLNAQLAQGFYIRRVLRDYLPSDHESHGHAVLMEWINPEWMPDDPKVRAVVRVAAVQYRMRPVTSFEQFADQCAYYADLASDFRSDFLLFPELLTNQLIPLGEVARPALRVRGLNQYTDRYVELFRGLAIKHNVNIIGGTHLVVENDVLYNVAYLFHRDGHVDRQYKLHITPSEARWWGVAPGDKLEVFDTDCGRIAINICYDVEFPELARVAKAKGANVLFVPYNTDMRSGHIRVRTCAHARCIENGMYVVLSGMCGGLPSIDWAEMHYARSAILTPSDIPFPSDGIGAEAEDNNEAMIVHDLDYTLLRRAMRQGAVRPWLDRRSDLYEVTWKGE